MTEMPDSPEFDDSKPVALQALWQDQPMEMTTMSLQALHTRATRFQSTVFWRNAREYAASLLVAVIFGAFALGSDDLLFQLGCGLMIAGSAFVCLFIYRNGRADRRGAATTEDCLNFHRQALIRQSRMLRYVWLWYLLPMLPGTVVFLWATDRSLPADQAWRSVVSAGFVVLVFVGVAALNAWGARCLDRELARLEA